MSKGKLYGVGVGPGDPELLTLKAIKTLKACPVVACPRTGNDRMLALEVVKSVVDLSGKTILPFSISMTKNDDQRAAEYLAAAEALAQPLAAGLDVALINLGDLSVFATFPYLAQIVAEMGFEYEMLPAVNSFAAAACALGVSLTERERGLYILSGQDEPERRLDLPGTKVLMKSAGALPQVLALLKEKGLLESSMLAANVGWPDQLLVRDMTAMPQDLDPGYFTLVIVKEPSHE